MAIAFVHALATTPASSSSATATLNLTTTNSATSGNTIIVVAASRGTNTPTSCTFTGGSLTWSTDLFFSNGTNITSVAIGSANAPAGLASASTLTATWSATSGKHAFQAFEFSGIATSSPKDQTGSSSNASGTNITGATPATTNAGDLAIGLWAYNASVTTLTGTAGTNTGTATGGTVTEALDIDVGTSAELYAYAEYQILTGTGTVNLNFTPSAAGTNIGAVATYLPAGVAATAHKLALLGVG